jgi:hypothetical protein
VGIPPEAIARAADYVGARGPIVARANKIRRRTARSFLRHLLVFVFVNAGIFAVDWLDGGSWFFYWPLILWGVLVAVLGLYRLSPDQEKLERRAERELERERKQAEKRARRAARKSGVTDHSRVEAEFDAAVKEGVSALLSTATKAMRRASSAARHYRVEDGEEQEPGSSADEHRASHRR